MIVVRRLLWDAWNVAHIARHSVTPEEVIEAARTPRWSRMARKAVHLSSVLPERRMLTVVLDPEGEGVYYPVTARPASRRERAIYIQERAKGGETQ